jgi:transcriptional regulator with AAA-type ATPase domain
MSTSTTQLLAHGLKYGDWCTVVPAGGNRRKTQLTRTAWEILPEVDVSTVSCAIGVPGVAARSFRWRLELTPVALEQERFLLRSMDGRPFALNGQWVKEAFVEDRDVLSSDGLGRLEFSARPAVPTVEAALLPPILSNTSLMVSRLPVLIQGETGTGKGHTARAIHAASGRAGKFVAVNVQSFPQGMVEAELFGHKKGAFTGAHADRDGALREARGGTLFVDEVDSLSRDLQTKLLLLLDDGSYRPIGGTGEVKADVRFLFATGRSLSTLVARGDMRADFYFRINQGARVELKPLRERIADIRRYCQAFGVSQGVSVSERLIDFYCTLPWPGNVRQLYGHLAAKKVYAKTRRLDFDSCDEDLVTMTSDLRDIGQLAEVRPIELVKKEYARWAVNRCQGEIDTAARQLEVHAKTLKAWLD